jgi:signal transduction histidine kinase
VTQVLSSGAESLDVFVALLSESDVPTPSRDYYDRMCEAVCRVSHVQRAILFLYDDALRRVVAAGSHHLDPGLLADLHVTLDEAPVARRALAEDRVLVVSGDPEHAIPAAYAERLGISTFVCVPLSAAGRWFGVLFADRGGGEVQITDTERDALWTLGKVAALAASARIAIRQEERTERLSERIDLAREIHEQVVQRLFGVSLALSAEHELTRDERLRCRHEIRDALSDLRTALRRPLATTLPETATTLREELDRLARRYGEVPVEVRWEEGVEVPPGLEPLAQSVLSEAFRNVHKHAEPTRVRVEVTRDEDALSLEVRNDGVRGDATPGTGMGLRLAQFEALQQGGVIEFGRTGRRGWRLRLVVPLVESP